MTAMQTQGASGVNTVTFWLPNLPPSINEVYAPGRSLYSNKPEWKVKDEWLLWQTRTGPYIKAFTIGPSSLVRVDLILYYDFYYPKQRSRLRTIDAHNMVKFMIDTLAKKLGFNDLIVKSGSWDSRHIEGAGKVHVTLTEIGEAEWKRNSDDLNHLQRPQ